MFNLYFAGSRQKCAEHHLISKKCPRLFSQSNERRWILEYGQLDGNVRPNLFVDSGAFSVAHSGKTVDVDEYIDFIKQTNDFVNVYAQLDSIPFPELNAKTARECSELSWQNYLYMVDKIPSPEKLLPLYHFGEPKENLKRILNTPIDALGGKPPSYIGIGGRHGVTTDQQINYFDDIFKIIQNSDNPNVKVHAFGVTVLRLLEQFPFFSADSTSYLKYAIYGIIITKYGGVAVSSRSLHSSKNLFSYHEKAKQAIMDIINQSPYTLEELSTDTNARIKFNIDFYKNWADNYTYKGATVHKKRLF